MVPVPALRLSGDSEKLAVVPAPSFMLTEPLAIAKFGAIANETPDTLDASAAFKVSLVPSVIAATERYSAPTLITSPTRNCVLKLVPVPVTSTPEVLMVPLALVALRLKV